MVDSSGGGAWFEEVGHCPRPLPRSLFLLPAAMMRAALFPHSLSTIVFCLVSRVSCHGLKSRAKSGCQVIAHKYLVTAVNGLTLSVLKPPLTFFAGFVWCDFPATPVVYRAYPFPVRPTQWERWTGIALGKKTLQRCISQPKLELFIKHKCFSVCYLPLASSRYPKWLPLGILSSFIIAFAKKNHWSHYHHWRALAKDCFENQ
jgi:hypothetical protein